MQERSFTRTLALYTFIVLIILLRPYAAYEISSRIGFNHDPEAVARILNRLVKKKETHVDDMDEAMEIAQSGPVKVVLPLVLVTFFRRSFAQLKAWLFGQAETHVYNTVFQLCPDNSFYQRTSRIRV